MVDSRQEMLRVRMSDRERTMLAELSEREQLTQSEYVRHLVRSAFEALPLRGQKRKKVARG
jgi:hypothetical protein